MDRTTQRPTLPCAAARPERIDDRLVLALDGGRLTVGGSPALLRNLAAVLRADGSGRGALLSEQLTEGLREHECETEPATHDHEARHGA